jgi:hypothetical protein
MIRRASLLRPRVADRKREDCALEKLLELGETASRVLARRFDSSREKHSCVHVTAFWNRS